MKYLQKEPFSVSMFYPRSAGRALAEEQRRSYERKVKAERPHEFLGAMMCQLCGMDSRAAIHQKGK